MAGVESFEELKSVIWAKWAQFKRSLWTDRPDDLVHQHGSQLQPAGEGHGHHNHPLTPSQKVWKYAKIIIFSGMLLFALFIWAYEKTEPEQTVLHHMHTIQHQHPTFVYANTSKPHDVFECTVQFPPEIAEFLNYTVDGKPIWMRVELEEYNNATGLWTMHTNTSFWQIDITAFKDDLDMEVKVKHEFEYEAHASTSTNTHAISSVASDEVQQTFPGAPAPHSTLRFSLLSNTYEPQAVVFEAAQFSYLINYRVAFAALVLGFVYVLIIFELLHRTLAAFLGAFLALGVLSFLDERATVHEVASWIEYETICLLLGMMIIVAIFSKTGFFELVGIKAYKLSKGSVWRLTLILSVFTAFVSAFLDNVTTMLLMTPVTIRLCTLVGINPIPMLISEVLMSNIGGTATAVGDPPVVIIVSNKKLSRRGISFGNVTGFLAPGAIAACVIGLLCIRVIYRHYFRTQMGGAPTVVKSTSDIELASTVRRGADDEEDDPKTEHSIDRNSTSPSMNDIATIQPSTSTSNIANTTIPSIFELEQTYRIKDMPLFIQCCVILAIVIVLFFLQSVVDLRLNLAWISLLGALALMLVTGTHEVAEIFEKVEWVTLGFFAGLFILMRGLEELELIGWIGNVTADMIMSVQDPDARLNIAILVLLWVSAFASAFIDNIPYVAAMIPITITLADRSGLPLHPLVYALGFGACLGGNGTLIGASANVVTSGISEGHGYPIKFTKFFKAGFPVMVATMVVATIYMLILNAVWTW